MTAVRFLSTNSLQRCKMDLKDRIMLAMNIGLNLGELLDKFPKDEELVCELWDREQKDLKDWMAEMEYQEGLSDMIQEGLIGQTRLSAMDIDPDEDEE